MSSRSAPAVKDLWTRIQEDQAAAKAEAAEPQAAAAEGAEGGDDKPKPKIIAAAGLETFLLFVGGKQSGKTSLIQHFLNRASAEENPKPTVALEYTFGRRSNTATNVKDIAHIWELGGGTHLSELVVVPITPQRLPNACTVVVVDMSKPEKALSSCVQWLQIIETRVRECLSKIKRGDPAKSDELKRRALQRMNLKADHPDLNKVEPSVVPIIIVCSKYDMFQDLESSRRKPLMLALRYVAHHYGASIVTTSDRDKTQLAYFRNMLNHFVFHTPAKKTARMDPAKPLVIPSGADSFDGIGAAPGARRPQMDDPKVSARIALWQRAVETYFPSQGDKEDIAAAADDASAWLEPSVDAMRAQKKEELDRYVKEAKQKLRMQFAGGQKKKSKKPRRKGRAEGSRAGAGNGAGAGSERSSRSHSRSHK